VFEKKVLRRIFEPKNDKLTGGCRKLNNEVLHSLYSSPSIIRMIQVKEDEMGRAYSTNGREEEYIYTIIVLTLQFHVLQNGIVPYQCSIMKCFCLGDNRKHSRRRRRKIAIGP
jgi:hypothetical protein